MILYLLGVLLLLISIIVTPVNTVSQNQNAPATIVVFGRDHQVSKKQFIHTYPSLHIRYVDPEDEYVIDDRTIALVINRCKNNELNGFTRIIGLSWEPSALSDAYLTPEYQAFVEKRFEQYLVPTLKNVTGTKFIESIPYLYINVPILEIEYSLEDWWSRKPQLISIALSAKKYLPGHAYRHALVREMIRRGIPIHIYGGGANEYLPFSGTKGPFKNVEPYADYKFHIAIENSCEDSYITEKYTQAIAQNCIPLYYGSPKLDTYFGKKSSHILTGSLVSDVQLITNVCNRPKEFWLDLRDARKSFRSGRANFAHALFPFHNGR